MKRPKWCCDCGSDFDAERAQCEQCHYCTCCCICQMEGKVTMDQEDQRDHAEEAANRATADQEAREELAAEEAERQLIVMTWRAYADTSARVALINMCDVYVRSHASPLGFAATLGKDLMAIMVCALHGVGAEEANVIVTEEIREAERRKGC